MGLENDVTILFSAFVLNVYYRGANLKNLISEKLKCNNKNISLTTCFENISFCFLVRNQYKINGLNINSLLVKVFLGKLNCCVLILLTLVEMMTTQFHSVV